MQFSQRTNWNTEESELALAYRKRVHAGLPIYDLTGANPTRCHFDYPAELLDGLSNRLALDYNPDPKGSRIAREAVAAYYADHHVSIDPDHLILTTSTSEAYSFLFRLLCDPGSEVLVPQPSYPLFDFLATLDDVRLKYAPLVYDEGWQIDSEGFQQAITPATRAIMLVHPNNPTGHFMKSWEVTELAHLCRERRLSLIVDEVFLDYRMEAQSAAHELSASFAAGLDGLSVYVVSGLSKIAALPQMKAAWIAVTGPSSTEALARLEVIADTFLSMNAPVQCAIPGWLSRRNQLQGQIRARVSANLANLDLQISQQAADKGLLSRLVVEGGWYAVLRIPALIPDEQAARELLEVGVWIHPGSFFGMEPSGWLVMSLLGPTDKTQAGVTRLIDYLYTNQKYNN